MERSREIFPQSVKEKYRLLECSGSEGVGLMEHRGWG